MIPILRKAILYRYNKKKNVVFCSNFYVTELETLAARDFDSAILIGFTLPRNTRGHASVCVRTNERRENACALFRRETRRRPPTSV